MNPGVEIKRRRNELRLSRAEAAQLAGVSPRTWMRIESNETVLANCRETTVISLAHALQWPVSRLTRSDEATNHFATATSVNGEVVAEEARLTFGLALASCRRKQSMSVDELAELTAIPTEQLSAVEAGELRLEPDQFKKIARHFPNDETLKALWLSSRTIVYDFARLGANNRMDIEIAALHDLELRCREMFWNCPQAVPGFAQTPAYTEQWLRRTTNMSMAGFQAASTITEKRVHSFIFRHPPTRLLFHFGFQFGIVDKRVMQEQLKHLVTLSTLEGVDIRVLKPHSAPTRGLFGSWGVLDKSLLHAYNLNGSQTNASPHIVGFFVEQFEEVWASTQHFEPIGNLLPL